jgi:hypothetical protein
MNEWEKKKNVFDIEKDRIFVTVRVDSADDECGNQGTKKTNANKESSSGNSI